MLIKPDISSIWIKLVRRGCRKLIIGGLCREFKYIRQADNSSENIRCQEARWRRMLQQWTDATRDCDGVIIGDMNLDFNTWNNPQPAHVTMTEDTKGSVEVAGFHQVINNVTCTLPGVVDSLINHCWVNITEKVLCKYNLDNAASDHNLIGVLIRLKGAVTNNNEFKKRKLANFCQEDYISKVSAINWTTSTPWTM